jgi:acetolactate synthase I/II/III large subunit
VDSAQLGNTYPIAEGLCGDARLALADLLAALRSSGRAPKERSAWLSSIRQMRYAWQAGIDRDAAASGRPINPRRVVAELQKATADEVVLLCDPGTPTPYVAAEFIQRRTGRQVISPRAQGGLGYAIPAMVGARLARPDAPVVGLCGDGSFVMSSSDLVTLARVGGPSVLILFNNGSYGWIKALQKLYHGGRSFSVDFAETMDYLRIAEGFGLRGERVTDPAEVGPALKKAMNDGGPYVLEIVTASEDTTTPPVAEWERLSGDER